MISQSVLNLLKFGFNVVLNDEDIVRLNLVKKCWCKKIVSNICNTFPCFQISTKTFRLQKCRFRCCQRISENEPWTPSLNLNKIYIQSTYLFFINSFTAYFEKKQTKTKKNLNNGYLCLFNFCTNYKRILIKLIGRLYTPVQKLKLNPHSLLKNSVVCEIINVSIPAKK